MATTANQPFGEWNSIFPDPGMTLAAVDRLVHHATIFEMNVESYCRRTAQARRSGPGRPANFSMPKGLEASRDNRLVILIVALQVIVEDFSKVFKTSAGQRKCRAGILVGAVDDAVSSELGRYLLGQFQ